MSGRRTESAVRVAWWRMWSFQGSFSPTHRQWLGWIVALEPTRDGSVEPNWVLEQPDVVNTNPYLAGMLVGAVVATERREGAGLARVVAQTLQSTLGALGDRLLWTGVRPALAVWTAVAVLWVGPLAAVGAWMAFAAGQARLRGWALAIGARHGVAIGEHIGGLGLHAWTDRARTIGWVGVGALTTTLAAGLLVKTPADPVAGPWLPSVGVAVAAVTWIAWKRWHPEWALVATAVVAWVAARIAA